MPRVHPDRATAVVALGGNALPRSGEPLEAPPGALGDPSLRGAAEVARVLDSDPTAGLTAGDAAARLDRLGPNRLEGAVPVPSWRKFLAHFADPLVYLLAAATVVSLVAWVVDGADGVPIDAIVVRGRCSVHPEAGVREHVAESPSSCA